MGVLAEFHHFSGTQRPDPFTIVNAGGAIRVRLPETAIPLAYETPSANPRLWNHGVAFCLPTATARMAGATIVTDCGVDKEAICEGDREDPLFDLGLGMRTTDFMVRTDDPALIRLLQRAVGRSWFEDAGLNHEIVAASPTRVVASALGRIEVKNAIPPPDGVSPEGPHTHVLPDILRHHRVHDANIPVPAGMSPGLILYPAHPARDAEGHERPFDPDIHAAYQEVLHRFGDRSYLAGKTAAGAPEGRIAHLGRIIAGRQRDLSATKQR